MIERSASGRVNLIGEHTDYNGGFVLPTAIPQRTKVALETRTDRIVRVRSSDYGEASYELGSERRRGEWIDYVQGITFACADPAIGGFDLAIESTIPAGSGLSSSAALGVAVLQAIDAAFALGLDPLEIAKLVQRSENELVGAPVGIMDPIACALADTTHAILLDARSLELRKIPMPDAELVVIDSGVRHALQTGDYRTRREECERAAKMLGVAALRDAPTWESLPSPLDRRARHVITENARVLEAAAAMERGDLETLGRLFRESHASMKDDFEVSVPEVDRLVAIACDHPDVYGARLTGGGFGGAVVALARRGSRAAEAIANAYGPAGRILVPEEK